MTTKTWHYAPVPRCSLPVLLGKAETQGDDVSLLLAVEQFGDRGELPPFSLQRLLEPFQHAS